MAYNGNGGAIYGGLLLRTSKADDAMVLLQSRVVWHSSRVAMELGGRKVASQAPLRIHMYFSVFRGVFFKSPTQLCFQSKTSNWVGSTSLKSRPESLVGSISLRRMPESLVGSISCPRPYPCVLNGTLSRTQPDPFPTQPARSGTHWVW